MRIKTKCPKCGHIIITSTSAVTVYCENCGLTFNTN